MRKKITEAIVLIVSVAAGFVFIETALVGALFLTTPRMPTDTSTCDEIKNIDGRWYCLGKMNGPDDNTTITRQVSEVSDSWR